MPTIYKTIRKDHDRHRELMKAISRTSGDSPTRRECWNALYYDVKAHAAAEEETFHARIMQKPDGQNDARHSVSEHKELNDLMEKLQATELSSPQWLKLFEKLRHDYEQHMDEEENEIFETAREVFSENRADEISDDFISRKSAEVELVDRKAAEALRE